jgi:hypothetical protein
MIIKILTLLIILFAINYIITNKKNILEKKKEKLIKINNADRITEHEDVLNILYSIEGYYYYNQQAYIDLIKYLENFLEIVDLCNIDDHYSTRLYPNLQDLKKLIMNTIISFEIKLPQEYNLKDVIVDMCDVLDKHLHEVYLIHENYIKTKGMDYSVNIIIPNRPDGYNVDNNILEPSKRLYFNTF